MYFNNKPEAKDLKNNQCCVSKSVNTLQFKLFLSLNGKDTGT